MVMLNPGRRQKIDLAYYGGENTYEVKTIPANKAGGIGVYGGGVAAYEWFLLDNQGEKVFFFIDEEHNQILDATDVIEGGDGQMISTAEAETLRHDSLTYDDVSERVFNQMLQAEKLAVAADFISIDCDMGVPQGYIKILHRLWVESRSNQ